MPGASGRPGPDDGDGAVRVVKDTVADRAQESAADAAAHAATDDQEVRNLRGVDKGVDGVGVQRRCLDVDVGVLLLPPRHGLGRESQFLLRQTGVGLFGGQGG